MNNEIIECEYCHTLITENDTICPKCGANCSKAIKKYKEEKQKKEQERAEKVSNFQKEVYSSFKKKEKFGQIFSIIIFIIVVTIMITVFTRIFSNSSLLSGGSSFNEETEKSVTVSYKETAETSKIKVTLDSYDLYEYHSQYFDNFNTPSGYQKIAFHFEIFNKSDEEMSTALLINLLADDSNVEKTSLELEKNFANLVKGKEKYEQIDYLQIRPNSTLKGYVGYLVPIDKKTLKFTVGNYITITMDNPAYKG